MQAQARALGQKVARPQHNCQQCKQIVDEMLAKAGQLDQQAAHIQGTVKTQADYFKKEANLARCAAQMFREDLEACNAGRNGPWKACGPDGTGPAAGPDGSRPGGPGGTQAATGSTLDEALAQARAGLEQQQQEALQDMSKAADGADQTTYQGTANGRNLASRVGSVSLYDDDDVPDPGVKRDVDRQVCPVGQWACKLDFTGGADPCCAVPAGLGSVKSYATLDFGEPSNIPDSSQDYAKLLSQPPPAAPPPTACALVCAPTTAPSSSPSGVLPTASAASLLGTVAPWVPTPRPSPSTPATDDEAVQGDGIAKTWHERLDDLRAGAKDFWAHARERLCGWQNIRCPESWLGGMVFGQHGMFPPKESE